MVGKTCLFVFTFLSLCILLTSTVKAAATGVIIPLYSYPGTNWTKVITAKNANPSVPIIAIINPANGPGSAKDNNYLQGITNLRTAGIKVLGYTYTKYGTRDPKADIDLYASWYPLDGIFFDEMANTAGLESWYSNLTKYAKGKGYTITVGNPGTDTLSSYVGTVDTIMIYESPGFPALSRLQGWHINFDKKNWSIIPYGVPTLNTGSVQSAEPYSGYIYVTDDVAPNPWDMVSTYFSNLVSTLASSTSISPTPTPPTNLHPGDVNGDGKIDIIDIGVIIDNYAKNPIGNTKADVNKDGVVDIIDIGIAIDNYGK